MKTLLTSGPAPHFVGHIGETTTFVPFANQSYASKVPTDVLQTAADALLNFKQTGLGIAEHSHRSEHASEIIKTAKADLASYLNFSQDDYEILFMQGGGSGEFSATVYNMIAVWVARRKEKILKELGKDVSEDVLVEELRKAVSAELVVDYLVSAIMNAAA